MAINPNELILDRVREMTFSDLSTGEIVGRLTNLEDPSLATAAEGEPVTDAIGSEITTIYRAKTATFSATNSLFSMDLAAQQFGATKELADNTNQIIVPAIETLQVSGGKVTLKNTPSEDIKFIYNLTARQLTSKYILGSSASATEFSISGNEITVPTSVSDGDYIYIEYTYSSSSAAKVSNKSDSFPSSVGVKIYAIFRDVCNDNLVRAGAIVAPKAKINPESIDIALTSTGKHAFEMKFTKDYCDESADLFSIIVAE